MITLRHLTVALYSNLYTAVIILSLQWQLIMNPARGFIIGIARKIGEPLIERTKCDFVGLPCWFLNLLKILSGHPYKLLSYAKDS